MPEHARVGEVRAGRATGTITEQPVFWNNFNYFKADSQVKPLPAATGGFNYPTGVGVVLFGTTGWTVSAQPTSSATSSGVS